MNEPAEKHKIHVDAPTERAAIEWLTLLQSSKMSKAQQAHFLKWLEQDPSHQLAFIQAEALWQRGAALSQVGVPDKEGGVTSSWVFWGYSGGALVAACILLVSILFLFVHNPIEPEIYFSKGTGHRPSHQLSDGSTIHLNINSSIEIEMSSKTQRLATLQYGEVFFDVAHNPKRPFVIQTRNGRVTVLGTRFSVRGQENKTVVTVLDGRVKLDVQLPDNGHTEVISKNQEGEMSIAQGLNVKSVDAAKALAWRDDVLHFAGEPLSQVVEQLNRYYEQSVEITDDQLGQLKIVAVLPLSNELKLNLETLATNLGLTVEGDEKNGVYRLLPGTE